MAHVGRSVNQWYNASATGASSTIFLVKLAFDGKHSNNWLSFLSAPEYLPSTDLKSIKTKKIKRTQWNLEYATRSNLSLQNDSSMP